MNFSLDLSKEILSSTPKVIKSLLQPLSADWTHKNEGPDTWSAFDIVGHLIHGEKTDWIPRARHIINEGTKTPFIPFDRFAQFKESKGKSLEELLNEFEHLRSNNLVIFDSLSIEKNLDKEGLHPELGKVSLLELISTWVVHDLNHIHQASRVLAHQFKDHVGPWKEYLGVLKGK